MVLVVLIASNPKMNQTSFIVTAIEVKNDQTREEDPMFKEADSRQSAKAIGGTYMLFLIGTFATFVLLDLSYAKKQLEFLKKNVSKKATKARKRRKKHK